MQSRVLFDLVLLTLLLTVSLSKAESGNRTNNDNGIQSAGFTKENTTLEKENSTDSSFPSDGPIIDEEKRTYVTSPDIHGLTEIQKKVLKNVVRKITEYLDSHNSAHQTNYLKPEFSDIDIILNNEVEGLSKRVNNADDNIDNDNDSGYFSYDDGDNNGEYDDGNIYEKYLGKEYGNYEEEEGHESSQKDNELIGNMNKNIEENIRKVIKETSDKEDNIKNVNDTYKYGGEKEQENKSGDYTLDTEGSSDNTGNKTKDVIMRIMDKYKPAFDGSLKMKNKENEIIDRIDPFVNEKLLELVIEMSNVPEKWQELYRNLIAQNQDEHQRIYSANSDKIMVSKKSLPALNNKKLMGSDNQNNWIEEGSSNEVSKKQSNEKDLRRQMLEKAGILRPENKPNKEEELGSKESKGSKQSKQTLKTQDITSKNTWPVSNQQHYTESNVWQNSDEKVNKMKSTVKDNKNNHATDNKESQSNKPEYQTLNFQDSHNNNKDVHDTTKIKNYNVKNENDYKNSRTQLKTSIKNNKQSPTTELRKLLAQNTTAKENKSSRGMHELYMKLGKLKSSPTENIRSNTARLSYNPNDRMVQREDELIQNNPMFEVFSNDNDNKLLESDTPSYKWQSTADYQQDNGYETHKENLPQQKQKDGIKNHKNFGVLAYTRYAGKNWENTSPNRNENMHTTTYDLQNKVSTDNLNTKFKNTDSKNQNYQNENFNINDYEDLSGQNLDNLHSHESSRKNGGLMAYTRYGGDIYKGPLESYDNPKGYGQDDGFKSVSASSSDLNMNQISNPVNSHVITHHNKNLNAEESDNHAAYKEEGKSHQNNLGLLAYMRYNEKYWKDPLAADKYQDIYEPNGVFGENENSHLKNANLGEKWKGNGEYKQTFGKEDMEVNEGNFPLYKQSNDYKSINFSPEESMYKQNKWSNLLSAKNRIVTSYDKNIFYRKPGYEPRHEISYMIWPQVTPGSRMGQYHAKNTYPIPQQGKYVTIMKFPTKLKSSGIPHYKTHSVVHPYHTMLSRMKGWLKKISKFLYPKTKEFPQWRNLGTYNTWEDYTQNMNKHYKQANKVWPKMPGKVKSSENLKLKLHQKNSRNGPHFIYHRVSPSTTKLTHKNAFVSVSVELPPRVNNSFRNWNNGNLGSSLPVSSMNDILEQELATLASKSWNHKKQMNKLKKQLKDLSALDKYLQYQWLKENALRNMLKDETKKTKSGKEEGSTTPTTYMAVGF